MIEPKDIQKIINEKAEQRLGEDIEKWLKSFKESRIWGAIEETKLFKEEDRDQEKLRGFFWNNTARGAKIIKEKLLPTYIDEESKAFMAKIESIRRDVDELNIEY